MGVFDKKKFDLQSAVVKIQGKIADIAQSVENTEVQENSTQQGKGSQESNAQRDKAAYCSNCGTRLNIGAKFCHVCGVAVGSAATSDSRKVEKDSNGQRETVYDGKIHKCPNCGEILESFVANCPSCGYEIRESRTIASVKEFALKLDQIEHKQMSHSSAMEKLFGKDLHDDSSAKQKIEEEKANLIINFPVPNTKEDILEFLILASSNIDAKKTDIITKAWLQKLEQVYQRAQITIGNANEFMQIKTIYDNKKKELNVQQKIKKYKIIGGASLIGLGIILIVLGMMLGESSGNPDSSLYFISFAGYFVAFGGIPIILSTANKN